ncbi:hypothetical protein PVL29_000463 [Vitis rotundifolia]|uniref:Bet v I/Major latex protein domain-containing protein n=1 Tax=Vitis rotundifolia TaxID=103349 RepID=A0AA39ALN2_VITRO|nr:hypothetical protein PVL29_000463 [Vitis rotundifolia]
MAQIAKMEVQAEIKSPASKFHEVYSRKSIEVVEGEWKALGSVQLWTYFIGGNTEEAKLVAERVDEENKTVTMNVVEGDILKYFKIFKCTIQVTVKDKDSLVTWSVEYEKLNESGPAPDAYLNFAMGIVENIIPYYIRDGHSTSQPVNQAHHLPNICSDKIHKIEVHEGDWETQGSVQHWSFTVGGNSESIKETVESIDEENRSITFKVLDGEVLKDYKSYKVTTQAIPKGEGCLVIWTIEYEKKVNEDVPDPHAYLEFAVNITKDIEGHYLRA